MFSFKQWHHEQGQSPQTSNDEGPVDRGRRAIIEAGIYGAGLLLFRKPFHGDVPSRELGPPVPSLEIKSSDEDSIRSRAEELSGYSVERLAQYLIDADNISFDPETPRIKTSIEWAALEGVFPLVDPEGDIKDGLQDVSPFVPVQKPLLVVLALLNDAGLNVEVNSIATSSEHSQSSNHYQGRGVDLAINKDSVEAMQFISRLHTSGIVKIDELFDPSNTDRLGLSDGKPSAYTEKSHIHFSTAEVATQERIPRPVLFEKATEDTAKILDELNISPASYFNLDRNDATRLAKTAGFDSKGASSLLPVFPAEVAKYKESIQRTAKKYSVSPNFIAAIMSIETSGRSDLSSSADAHGVIQVVPKYHRDRIDRIAGQQFDNDAARGRYLLDNPEASIEIGSDYLAGLLAKARKDQPELDPNDSAIYARAAAGYNGGPARTKEQFEQWPLESKKYANFMSAFYLDVSVAGELRNRADMSDEQIALSMRSETMYARMVAFRAMGASQGNGGYKSLSDAYRRVEVASPGCIQSGEDEIIIVDAKTRALYNLALAGYDNFKNDAALITPGLPPALTFLNGHGNIRMFNGSRANTDQADALAAAYRE